METRNIQGRSVLSMDLHRAFNRSKPSDALPVKIKAPKKLPKISLVNESLKKHKFYLAKFDSVVKIRTTPNAPTEVMNSMSLIGDTVNKDGNRKESCNLKAEHLKSQNAFNDLLKSHSQLEKHSQLQDKDNTICKLKNIIKSLREKSEAENVNYDYEEIETKNVELENSVAKLSLENERLCNEINHVKQFFKEQFDSIKKTRVHTKEQSDSLVDKPNLKSAKNKALKAQIQDKELLVYVRDTCPNAINHGERKVVVTLKNKVKKVRFVEPFTSSSNIKQVESSITSDSNTPVLSPIGLKCTTSNYGSKPTCNKKNDRISQTPSRNMKNKVEGQAMNKYMFDGVHDLCILDFVKNVNIRAKSAKKHKKQNIWKPTGHVFTEVGFKWKPTGRIFTIVGNSCPVTRITLANVVPPKKTTFHSVETQKPKLKLYSIKPKNVKNIGSSKKAKIVEYKKANHSEPNHTWGSNATDIPSSSSLVMTVRLGNDHIARIIRYGDYQLGNVTISRVYYIEGLGHNLFSVGQFCDAYLKVAFQKNTCFIPSKTKSWLWHRQLSHLNFGTLNKLAKDGLASGIPRLKFQKDHLCSACTLGKSKKSSHQTKAKDTNHEKLYLLHKDLCGPMRVASINGKKYILVIVDDYSRLTWVRFFRSKDEASEAIIKCIQNIQDKKLDLSFFHVFGALCYPTDNNDDLGKLDAKADIGIFVGYAPAKKAIRIYNKRTQKIIETIHVTFDELTAMASVQFSSGPGLHSLTSATSSSRLFPDTVSQQPCILPNKDDWDHLFQHMFDEYFTSPLIVVSLVQEGATPRAVVLTESPVSTFIDQDAPSTSTPSTQEQEKSPKHFSRF
nr:hypothetical protein [Tanacetum cinerariifolium]